MFLTAKKNHNSRKHGNSEIRNVKIHTKYITTNLIINLFWFFMLIFEITLTNYLKIGIVTFLAIANVCYIQGGPFKTMHLKYFQWKRFFRQTPRHGDVTFKGASFGRKFEDAGSSPKTGWQPLQESWMARGVECNIILK